MVTTMSTSLDELASITKEVFKEKIDNQKFKKYMVRNLYKF